MNNPGGERESSWSDSSGIELPRVSADDDRWAVILAGGDGSRLLPLTRKISGDERPKQFCPIINGNTLLDDTRRRVALTFSREQTMFVLTQKHARYYDDALSSVPKRNLIEQPKNLGTAPAILYSLLRLERISPTAAVAFFPSDHYFSDDRAFMSEVDFAFAAARRNPDSIVLLGVEPERADDDYGWIEPVRGEKSIADSSDLRRVRRFWEKPAPALARELMRRGCLWNSFVMVGAVGAFLKMIRRSAHELFARFATVRSKLLTPDEENAVRSLYDGLPDSDFSHDVLQARSQDLMVLPVRGSAWSDLGTSRRVYSTLSVLEDASRTQHEPAPPHLMNLLEGYYEQTRVCGSEIA